jgi:hypothetical protein
LGRCSSLKEPKNGKHLFSSSKIELIGTGEQAGTWGTTTNSNLGTALEQAIVGKADVTMSSTTITLTLANSNAAQTHGLFTLT